MDYEQDARDKQTYASFGGRKPQLLGDDRDALIASQARRIEELEKAANRLADRNCTYDTNGLFIPFDSHAEALAAMIDLRALLNRGEG